MEQQGRLTQWNDARGFGFITPLAGGPQVFVHISQFQQKNRRPCLHDPLTYTIGRDEQGRSRALQVRYQQKSQPESGRSKSFLGALAIKVAVFLLACLATLYVWWTNGSINQKSKSIAEKVNASAFQGQRSGAPMGGDGEVVRVLADDNVGSRHQRFILRLDSGQTLLIAHNIDIAPRIETLKTGDRVAFYGQFEANPEGGVIHWTHHDPEGHHGSGWLKHNGTVYQ